MSSDLRNLFEQASNVLGRTTHLGAPAGPPAAPPATPSQRPKARSALEACWAPLWKAVEPTLVDLVLAAVGPHAKSEDEAEARRAKFVLARDRQFAQAYFETLRTEYGAQLKDFLTHKSADPASAEKAPKIELSLVDYGDMEMSTRVERAAARIRNANDEVVRLVQLRLANLVKEPEIRDSDNPFRPAMFYRATIHALERIGTREDDLLEVLPLFDAPLVKTAAAAYRGLDEHLKAQGLVADLTPSTGWRSTLMRTGRGTQTGGDGSTQPMAIPRGVNAENVLQALYQRLHLLPPGGGPVASGAVVAGAAPALPGAAGPAGLPASQFPSGPLAGQSAGPAAVQPVIAAPIVIDANLLTAINEIQKLSALALSAAQHGGPAPDAAINAAELRNKLVEKATEQVDKLTIEIVGMLFERINSDKHVPREIKELLQRLQFPLIKVALTDPELFVAPDQPARVLMDRIASTSIGWTPQGEDNQRFFAEVQGIVQRILASIDDGLDVFRTALEDFERFLAEEKTRDDDPVARAKRALAEAESREIMAINATIKIRNVFDGVQIESYLREFLLDTWVRVLVAAWIKEKGEHALVRRYLDIVPDLVWSVQPKINPDDRKRLVGTIPPVLTALREGLTLIQCPQEQMQQFFGRLMNSHAQAVKALELAHGVATPTFEPSTMRIKLDGIRLEPAAVEPEVVRQAKVSDAAVRQALAANQADVEHLTAPPPALVDAVDASDEELDDEIARWRRGDWFGLRVGDITERVRLRWVSPMQTLYLFTPADGSRAHSLSPAMLRAYLRSGALQPVEAVPLFDRAVQGVMIDLKHALDAAPAAAG
jgi:hypothetical protein